MSAKMTLQQFSELFAKSNGITKKTSETFIRHMFDSVLEGVMSDGVVKIKGLGTFKLVDVGQRESVSVSTGERLLIPGYKKVNFIPEETLNELIGKDFISGDEYDEDDSDVEDGGNQNEMLGSNGNSEVCAELDKMLAEKAVLTDVTEEKSDEFSGIDLIISTPESIEGMKDELWKARNDASVLRAKAEQAISQAKAAELEVMRLEKLIERLENHEDSSIPNVSEEVRNVEDAVVATDKLVADNNENPSDGTAEVQIQDKRPDASEVEKEMIEWGRINRGETPKKNRKGWVWVLMLLLLLIGCACFYFLYVNRNVENTPTVDPVVKTEIKENIPPLVSADTIVEDTVHIDSLATDAIMEVADEGDVADDNSSVTMSENAQQSSYTEKTPMTKPDKYVLKEGETLTMLARRYYGSSDYVVDIINANNFADPNNVHVGAIVILP